MKLRTLANMLHQVCRIKRGDESNSDELHVALIDLAASHLVGFMPGSNERRDVERRIRQGQTLRFLDATGKYVRNCIESGAQVFLPVIHSMFRAVTDKLPAIVTRQSGPRRLQNCKVCTFACNCFCSHAPQKPTSLTSIPPARMITNMYLPPDRRFVHAEPAGWTELRRLFVGSVTQEVSKAD